MTRIIFPFLASILTGPILANALPPWAGGGGHLPPPGTCGFPLIMCGSDCCNFQDCKEGQCGGPPPPPNCGSVNCDLNTQVCFAPGQCLARQMPNEPQYKYQFRVDSIEIDRTRSKHHDTLFISASVAVAGQTPVNLSMPLGNYGDGTLYPNISMEAMLRDDDVALFTYHVINAGNTNPDVILQRLEDTAKQVAVAGAKGAANAIGTTIGAAAGAEIGALIGSSVPVIGTIVGAALGALIGTFFNDVIDIVDPDCDGPLASGAYALLGSSLRSEAANSPYTVKDYNPGINSADGCGHNSKYYTTWSVSSVSS